MTNLVKTTVNLTQRGDRALNAAAAATGDSKTDTVNRALQVYALLVELQGEDPDSAIYFRRSGGELERVNVF